MANKITSREVLTLIVNGVSNETTVGWASEMLAKMDQKNCYAVNPAFDRS